MQFVVAGRIRLDKARRTIGATPVDTIQHQAVQMYVGVGRRTEALDQRDGAAMAFVGLELGTGQQMAREHALHHMQHRLDQLGLCGQQHAKRDGQGQDPLPHRHVGNDVIHEVRRGLRRAPHDGQNPRRLQLNASSLS